MGRREDCAETGACPQQEDAARPRMHGCRYKEAFEKYIREKVGGVGFLVMLLQLALIFAVLSLLLSVWLLVRWPLPR